MVESILYPQNYIVSGYENANMPSYDGQLNEEQVAGLAAYIRLINDAATTADTTLSASADSSNTVNCATAGRRHGRPQRACR